MWSHLINPEIEYRGTCEISGEVLSLSSFGETIDLAASKRKVWAYLSNHKFHKDIDSEFVDTADGYPRDCSINRHRNMSALQLTIFRQGSRESHEGDNFNSSPHYHENRPLAAEDYETIDFNKLETMKLVRNTILTALLMRFWKGCALIAVGMFVNVPCILMLLVIPRYTDYDPSK